METSTRRRESEQDLYTHTLRRSQVALLVAQGEHPKVIADRLGHTSVHTVLHVYGHLYDGADETAAERLDTQIRDHNENERNLPTPGLGR